jgi:hypothetical protein
MAIANTKNRGALKNEPQFGPNGEILLNKNTVATGNYKPQVPQAPQLTRVSPGIYRDASGKLVRQGAQATPTKTTTTAPTNNPASAGGAMSQDPNFKLGSNTAALEAQLARNEAELKRKGGKNSVLQNRINQITGALNTARGNPINPNETPTNIEDTLGYGSDAINEQLRYIGQQGEFNPGDFGQAVNQSRDAVMNEFNRVNEPKFQQEEQNFRNLMASRGVPEGSEAYNRGMQDLKETQNQARISAGNQAYQTGMQAQAQGYGQAQQTYQMPYQNMAAFNPYFNVYGQQLQGKQQADLQVGQNKFTQEQAARENQYRLQQIRTGGGGGMSLQDKQALMAQEFYNNLVLNYGGKVGGGKGFTQGLTQGIGSGIGMGVQYGMR